MELLLPGPPGLLGAAPEPARPPPRENAGATGKPLPAGLARLLDDLELGTGRALFQTHQSLPPRAGAGPPRLDTSPLAPPRFGP